MFKTCLDYWNYFVPDVYASACTSQQPDPEAFSFNGPPANTQRKSLYAGMLSKLRQLMINRMAKPEVGGIGLCMVRVTLRSTLLLVEES